MQPFSPSKFIHFCTQSKPSDSAFPVLQEGKLAYDSGGWGLMQGWGKPNEENYMAFCRSVAAYRDLDDKLYDMETLQGVKKEGVGQVDESSKKLCDRKIELLSGDDCKTFLDWRSNITQLTSPVAPIHEALVDLVEVCLPEAHHGDELADKVYEAVTNFAFVVARQTCKRDPNWRENLSKTLKHIEGIVFKQVDVHSKDGDRLSGKSKEIISTAFEGVLLELADDRHKVIEEATAIREGYFKRVEAKPKKFTWAAIIVAVKAFVAGVFNIKRWREEDIRAAFDNNLITKGTLQDLASPSPTIQKLGMQNLQKDMLAIGDKAAAKKTDVKDAPPVQAIDRQQVQEAFGTFLNSNANKSFTRNDFDIAYQLMSPELLARINSSNPAEQQEAFNNLNELMVLAREQQNHDKFGRHIPQAAEPQQIVTPVQATLPQGGSLPLNQRVKSAATKPHYVEEADYKLITSPEEVEQQLQEVISRAQQNIDLRRKETPDNKSPRLFDDFIDGNKGYASRESGRVSLRSGRDTVTYSSERGLSDTGAACSQGVRPDMEDAHLATTFHVSIQGQNIPVELSCVFDGHGGPQAARYCAENIAGQLKAQLEQFNQNGMCPTGIVNALNIAFVQLSNQIQFRETGTTANAVMKIGNTLWTANLGDSRAIAVNSEGKVIQLSEDASLHDPRYADEVRRRGGRVERGRDGTRINGQIAVAGTLGYTRLNGAALCRPTITRCVLPPSEKEWTIVQVCDGITDAATSLEIANAAKHYLNNGDSEAVAAAKIVHQTELLMGTDNKTVVVRRVKYNPALDTGGVIQQQHQPQQAAASNFQPAAAVTTLAATEPQPIEEQLLELMKEARPAPNFSRNDIPYIQQCMITHSKQVNRILGDARGTHLGETLLGLFATEVIKLRPSYSAGRNMPGSVATPPAQAPDRQQQPTVEAQVQTQASAGSVIKLTPDQRAAFEAAKKKSEGEITEKDLPLIMQVGLLRGFFVEPLINNPNSVYANFRNAVRDAKGRHTARPTKAVNSQQVPKTPSTDQKTENPVKPFKPDSENQQSKRLLAFEKLKRINADFKSSDQALIMGILDDGMIDNIMDGAYVAEIAQGVSDQLPALRAKQNYSPEPEKKALTSRDRSNSQDSLTRQQLLQIQPSVKQTVDSELQKTNAGKAFLAVIAASDGIVKEKDFYRAKDALTEPRIIGILHGDARTKRLYLNQVVRQVQSYIPPADRTSGAAVESPEAAATKDIAGKDNQQKAAITDNQRKAFKDVILGAKAYIKPEHFELIVEEGLLADFLAAELLGPNKILYKDSAVSNITDMLKKRGVNVDSTTINRPKYSESVPFQQSIAWNEPGFRDYLIQQRLVSSQDEFSQFFGCLDASVEFDPKMYTDRIRNKFDYMIRGLRNFRVLQSRQKELGFEFIPQHFVPLLFKGALDDSFSTADVSILAARIGLLESEVNVIPATSGADKARELGFHPVSNGLHNPANSCYMNSVLQSMAHSFRGTDVLRTLRREIPYSVARNIMRKSIPADTPDRDNLIKQWADALHTNPSNVNLLAQRGFPEAERKIQSFLKFKTAFVNLCERLIENTQHPVALAQLQLALMQAHVEYAIEINDDISKFLFDLDGVNKDKLLVGRLEQRDAEEYQTKMLNLLGLDEDSNGTVKFVSHLKTYTAPTPQKTSLQEGRSRLLKVTPNMLQAPITFSAQSKETLQEYVDDYVRDELMIEVENKKIRDNPDNEELLAGTDETVEVAQQFMFEPMEGRIPDIFRVQAKIFDFREGSGTVKLADEAISMMGRMGESNFRLNLPLHNPDTNQTERYPYQLNSIVCHKGNSPVGGHYITVRFDNGKIVVCDDSVVLDWQEYAAYRGNPPYKNWEDFCKREALAGYLYTFKPAS